MLRLCSAAGRRLDLLQLPRSGFGQLALVPLGYLLLLLWTWGLELHPLGLMAWGFLVYYSKDPFYNPWRAFHQRPMFNLRYSLDGLLFKFYLLEWPLLLFWGFVLGVYVSIRYGILHHSYPVDAHWWEIKRSLWLTLGEGDIGPEPPRKPRSPRQLRFPGVPPGHCDECNCPDAYLPGNKYVPEELKDPKP